MEKNVSRKKKVFFVAFFVVLFGGIVLFFFLFFRGPSVGTVVKKEADISREEISVEKKVKEFRGRYFVMTLPESFVEKRHEASDTPPGNTIEQAFFSQEDLGGQKLAVVIDRRPTGGVAELSAFQFRKLEKESYASESVLIGKRRVSVFKKEGGVYEVTGFFEEDSFVASVSVSSAVIRPEELFSDFSEVVKSFTFLLKNLSSP